MTGESPTKTREEPPTANREVTPTTTKEESQPQIESWLYPETSLEPPATSRKENPSKTRDKPGQLQRPSTVKNERIDKFFKLKKKKDFLNRAAKILNKKEKMYKLGGFKIKNLCSTNNH